MTFVCRDKIRTSCVLDILTSCELYMFHMYGVIIHTRWDCLLARKWLSSGVVSSKGIY